MKAGSHRFLVVGDPHVTSDSLKECNALLEYVEKCAVDNKADSVLFLGDLYHTHAILHVEVMAFWSLWTTRLKASVGQVYCLVGNHDMPGNDGASVHALIAQEATATVVDKPLLLADLKIGMMPYFSDTADFRVQAEKLVQGGAKTIFAHQTFAGSMFEAGFYAPDGVDVQDLDCQFISGHIHTPQKVGKVWYPGAPRWRSLADANVARAVWLLDFKDGEMVSAKPFSTSGVCREIRHMELKEGMEIPEITEEDGISWSFDIRGSEAFVDGARESLKGKARVRGFVNPPETKHADVRESAGIPVALRAFLESFSPPNGTPKEVLADMASKRGLYG